MALAAIGIFAYRLLRDFDSSPSGSEEDASSDELKGTPVEHGRIAGSRELHGHGKLYLVPVGKQVVPVPSLAAYYRRKFGIEVTVLSDVKVQPSDCVPERKQCVAQDLQREMTNAYPEIARDRESVMIALTDEDIFPRDTDWDFTYSWHMQRTGIISTHRLDPAFWGEPRDDDDRLASTRQFLTKYVAMLYFHLPENNDPTSILYSDLTSDGGPDDLYESDLRPDQSVNGRQGSDSPCLFIIYSYRTHQASVDSPLISECFFAIPAHSDEDVFQIELDSGRMIHRSRDLTLNTLPRIEFKRGYGTGYEPGREFALGWSTNHSYDAWMGFVDSPEVVYFYVAHEDRQSDLFFLKDGAQAKDPNAVYEGTADGIHSTRLVRQNNEYKLQYPDGASSFFPCADNSARCYQTGYQDAKGNALHFHRDSNRQLRQLLANDGRGITLQYGDHDRLLSATASGGKKVSYSYDAAGCLVRVQRTDGQIAVYEYDSNHRMTSFSVSSRRGATPEKVLSYEYDAKGNVARLTFVGGGTYAIEHPKGEGEDDYEVHLKLPSGEVLTVKSNGDDYEVRSSIVPFRRSKE